MCLSLLPTTVLADDLQTMTTGDIVAENQPFQVYLGDKPVSTVIVKYPINGEAKSFDWSKSEQTGQDWAIQDKYLTVGGKYVSAGGNDSLVGMTLTGVEFDYLRIKYDNGTLRGYFLFRWDSEANKYKYVSHVGDIGAVSNAIVTINGETGSLSFQLVDDSNIYNGGFNPDEARRTVLTFEDRSKLPTTPLEAGDSYNHYLSDNGFVIKTPLYAVVHGTNDCYQVYEGSEVGLNITSWDDDQRTAIANLTVSENSPLVGTTFTGEVYNASMANFTGSDGSKRDLLIYEYSYNPDAGEVINYFSYKCIVDGKIVDLKNTFSDDWLTLTFEENGVRYEATSPQQYFTFYVMTNRVLFFNTADSPTTTYTVSFNANGGSVTPESATTGADGKLATLPTPTRDGYRFDGWYTAAVGGEKITKDTVFTADTTVYAHWTKKTTSGSSGSGSNSGTAIVQSAKTADIGVMIYGMTALLSLTGGAWMIGKKKEH